MITALSKITECTIHSRKITLFIGSKDDFISWASKRYEDIDDWEEVVMKTYLGVTFDTGEGGIVIFMEEFNLSILVHEIYHAVFYLFDSLGEKLTNENQEKFAYTYQFIFNQLYEKS